MASLFMSALLALSASPAAAAAPLPSTLDRQCYALMAHLAQDEDPRVSSAALTGAQYFLGRLDSAAPGADAQAPAEDPPRSDRETSSLIAQCSEVMGAGGRDFQAIGARLARARQTI